MIRQPPRSPLFPYPPLSRSAGLPLRQRLQHAGQLVLHEREAHRVDRHDRFRVLDEVTELAVADRKSTRLNSSHANISYAVFCLNKKILSLPTLSHHLILFPP